MKNNTVWVIIVIILLGLLGWVIYSQTASAPNSSTGTNTTNTSSNTTQPPASDFTVFSSTDYNFSFNYPKTFSVVPQNFADTRDMKTLVTLENADKSQTVHVSILMDANTGKPIPPTLQNYENAIMKATIFDGSGASPKSFSEFTSRTLGAATFASIKTGVFEGVLGYNYFAMTPKGIVRFILVSRGVDWTNPQFDPEQDKGHLALKTMLGTFKLTSVPNASSVSYAKYVDGTGEFSIDYPSDWTVNKNFSYQALGPNVSLKGVAFNVPASWVAATNLSASDSYVSVERNPAAASSCTADKFVSGSAAVGPTQATFGTTTWSKIEGADVAAGNLYNEIVYSLARSGRCYGIRLSLHSGNIANYDAGAVQMFNKSLFQAIEDHMVASVSWLK